jgi:hypothetical protein
MTETWRPILLGLFNLPSHYEVSSIGRVRNSSTGRVIKSYFVTNRNGDLYEKVDLWRGNLRHKRFVHRLVCEAFHPNPEQKSEVNHGDCNTLNNAEWNVEWRTRLENEEHKRFMRATA